MWWILWLVLALLAVAGIIALVVLAERKRRRLLREWAARTGLAAYEPAGELSWLREFKAWGPGYGHKAFDGFEGNHNGAAIRVFQHQSRTKNKDSESIHNFTVCVAHAAVFAPRLRIEREHLGHKLVDALGGEDIDFESAEFSKKFWVKCSNRRFAYDVIHPRAMEFLLDAPKMHWEWIGNRLVVHVSGALKPERAEPLMDAAAQFLAMVPAHLEAS